MSKELVNFFNRLFDEHNRVASDCQKKLQSSFLNIINICIKSLKRKKKILFFGNGGSASDALHLSTVLTVSFSVYRKPISAISIKTTTDAGGKLNYENAFKYMEDVGVLSDPDEFIKDITRAFGKYDPNMPNPVTGQMGMHVLGDEGKQIVGNLLTNYVGSKIAKEATKKIIQQG